MAYGAGEAALLFEVRIDLPFDAKGRVCPKGQAEALVAGDEAEPRLARIVRTAENIHHTWQQKLSKKKL